MGRYLLRRLVATLIGLIGATMIVFMLSRAVGDPRYLYAQEGYGLTPEMWDAMGEKMGLNRPLIVQYAVWLGRTVRGDLGESLLGRTPVSQLITERISATLQLGLAAWFLSTIIGIPLGVLSAVKRGTMIDLFARGFAALGQAAPPFWIGIIAIFFFAVQLGVLPPGDRGDGPFYQNFKYFILPASVLAWQAASAYLRITRSAMIEIMDSEYIVLARAKGVVNVRVIWKHAFKNALIPPLTLSALILAGFIHGSVVVETVFTWPGLGRLAVDSVQANDFPTMTGVVLLFAVIYMVMNLLADIAYGLLDPRIRYT